MRNSHPKIGLYERIREAFYRKFGDIPDRAIAEKLGLSHHLVSKWRNGNSRPTLEVLEKIQDETGVSLDFLITGKFEDEKYSDDIVLSSRYHEPIPFVLEAKAIMVVGEAAADETQGSEAGFFPPDSNARYDAIEFPETTSAVQIIGDSMSPLLLDGQYALIGPEYFGGAQLGDYDVVVVDVAVKDEDMAAADQHWEGVYCKRVVDAGDTWLFLSINHTGTPFTVAKTNCRLWPVLGVWFGGMGKPPVGD